MSLAASTFVIVVDVIVPLLTRPFGASLVLNSSAFRLGANSVQSIKIFPL